MSASADNQAIEKHLARLAEVVRLLETHFLVRRSSASLSDLELLRTELLRTKSIANPWPAVLDATFQSVIDILARTHIALRAAPEEVQTEAWWAELVERTAATAAHIQRMQSFHSLSN